MNVTDDVNRACRAGSDVDVSGAGGDVEGGRAADGEGLIEGALGGEESCGGEREGENSCCVAKVHGSLQTRVRRDAEFGS